MSQFNVFPRFSIERNEPPGYASTLLLFTALFKLLYDRLHKIGQRVMAEPYLAKTTE